jgi:hypothetical protein
MVALENLVWKWQKSCIRKMISSFVVIRYLNGKKIFNLLFRKKDVLPLISHERKHHLKGTLTMELLWKSHANSSASGSFKGKIYTINKGYFMLRQNDAGTSYKPKKTFQLCFLWNEYNSFSVEQNDKKRDSWFSCGIQSRHVKCVWFWRCWIWIFFHKGGESEVGIQILARLVSWHSWSIRINPEGWIVGWGFVSEGFVFNMI